MVAVNWRSLRRNAGRTGFEADRCRRWRAPRQPPGENTKSSAARNYPLPAGRRLDDMLNIIEHQHHSPPTETGEMLFISGLMPR
jgi:hypothetical protein